VLDSIYLTLLVLYICLSHLVSAVHLFISPFIIKYNVFNKYIINVTTTEINTCKTIFEFGQREVISFFTLVTSKGGHSIIYSK
jgi:uncharacterized membrane protein YccF (DUF307 family)